jgi:hypothetical protein
MCLNGARIVLRDDVIPSLPRKCGDVHMRLADLDVLGSAYVPQTTSIVFLSTTSFIVAMRNIHIKW